ncbi:MAG: DUF805 domain-containing protein [Ferrovibrio sp.]
MKGLTLSHLFRFSGRLNRLSFVTIYLSLFVLTYAASVPMMIGALSGLSEPMRAAGGSVLMNFLFYVGLGAEVLLGVLMAMVAAHRCRDINVSGWFGLLSVVPLLGLVFALIISFIPGTLGPNRYGPDPLGPEPDLAA